MYYDSIPRCIILESLEAKGVSRSHIEAIRDMYDGASTNIQILVGITKSFPIRVGLHQGSPLSPFLFAVIIDELSKSIWDTVLWCMLFADDIVLVAETSEEANTKLEEWRAVLESHGLRISRTKIDYLRCNFSGDEQHDGPDVTIEEDVVASRTKFKYLGSIIQNDGEIDGDVTHCIQAGWLKWRSATGVLCDKKFPIRLKGKFYRVAIRPALLYGIECWSVKKIHEQKMEMA